MPFQKKDETYVGIKGMPRFYYYLYVKEEDLQIAQALMEEEVLDDLPWDVENPNL